MKHDLKPGQAIWIVERNHRGGRNEPRQTAIENIGREYFTLVESGRARKFYLSTLKQAAELNYPAQCYVDIQEYLDLQECESLSDQIRAQLGQYGVIKLPLSALRQIKSIIDEAK